MRWNLSAACLLVLGLVVAGCYSPQVKNGGFTCVATDDPPCPNGYFCVAGLCVSDPAQMVAADMSIGPDFALPINDFSAGPDIAHAQQDLASSGDMAMGGSCGVSGDQCITQSCCPGAVCFLLACI